MKSIVSAVVLLILGTVAAPAIATTIFEATLSGTQEVPPVVSPANGTALLTLNPAQTRLEMSLTLTGIDLDGNQTADTSDDLVGLHIHRASAGANGAVVFGLFGPNSDTNSDLVIDAIAGTVFSAWDLNEGLNTTLAAELQFLLANGLYLNVHTQEFPAGEIRGQILRVPLPAPIALLGLGMLGLALVRGRTRA